ncbi:MAG: hypothetical protein JXB36_03470 [Gammaproteobacteria bacterium]|nr:hypothetical protein [Gammaproteobacteria bacterium]
MAAFSPNARSPASPVTLAALAACSLGVAAAQTPAAPEGLDLSAEEVAYDGGTSRVAFEGLTLRQGDMLIAADHATSTSLESEYSEWTLSGDVRIEVGSARLTSDEAHFTMQDNVLSQLELIGSPATFEDPSPQGAEAASGGANRISYDDAGRSVSLLDDAWLRVGANEVTGCDLVYDVDEGTFRSGSTECDQPFRIRIARPPEENRTEEAPPESP